MRIGESMTAPDLMVIGGGAAGLSAARTARALQRSVVMVSGGPPGGDCTFTGCVPSKTLLAAGRVPFGEAMARVRETVAAIASDEDIEALAREGIDVVTGRASVVARDRVTIGARTYRPRRIVIATGARPLIPPIRGLTEVPYLTSDTLFDLDQLPTHLMIIGGGPIGVEMAQAFRQFGAQVTIVEAADRLLGREEPQASAVIEGALRGAGVTVKTGAAVASVGAMMGAIEVSLGAETLTASHLLIAVGRQPNLDGLAELGLALTDQSAIRTTSKMKTSITGVYAAGDVTGRSAFTHAADEMGRVAATNALRRLPLLTFAQWAVPAVTFTTPEVARVGLTEAQAHTAVKGARVVELQLSELDRARTVGEMDGFIKVIVAPKSLTRNLGGGKVIGATIVAPRAGEMIAELALALRTSMFAGRIAQTSHAYPTWSIGVQQVIGQLFGYGSGQPRATRSGK